MADNITLKCRSPVSIEVFKQHFGSLERKGPGQRFTKSVNQTFRPISPVTGCEWQLKSKYLLQVEIPRLDLIMSFAPPACGVGQNVIVGNGVHAAVALGDALLRHFFAEHGIFLPPTKDLNRTYEIVSVELTRHYAMRAVGGAAVSDAKWKKARRTLEKVDQYLTAQGYEPNRISGPRSVMPTRYATVCADGLKAKFYYKPAQTHESFFSKELRPLRAELEAECEDHIRMEIEARGAQLNRRGLNRLSAWKSGVVESLFVDALHRMHLDRNCAGTRFPRKIDVSTKGPYRALLQAYKNGADKKTMCMAAEIPEEKFEGFRKKIWTRHGVNLSIPWNVHKRLPATLASTFAKSRRYSPGYGRFPELTLNSRLDEVLREIDRKIDVLSTEEDLKVDLTKWQPFAAD